jgi:small-conductance mechanosensitive channel
MDKDPDNIYNSNNSLRRTLLGVLFIIIALMGGLFVLDLWFDLLSFRVLGKIMLTLIVAAVILAVGLLIRSHIRDEERMAKNKFFNGES